MGSIRGICTVEMTPSPSWIHDYNLKDRFLRQNHSIFAKTRTNSRCEASIRTESRDRELHTLGKKRRMKNGLCHLRRHNETNAMVSFGIRTNQFKAKNRKRRQANGSKEERKKHLHGTCDIGILGISLLGTASCQWIYGNAGCDGAKDTETERMKISKMKAYIIIIKLAAISQWRKTS